jgi:pimeloyl-ACP methyl ester carboxylesterase
LCFVTINRNKKLIYIIYKLTNITSKNESFLFSKLLHEIAMKSFRKRPNLLISLLGLVLAITSLSVIYIRDEALFNSTLVSFSDPQGDILIGTYYPGFIDAGVIILEGFGSDQIAVKGIASEFALLGFHVFTFDFSAHGRSLGKLGLDNAATDRLAKQVLSAKTQFKLLSGLEDPQIILLGHSMGARVALQSTTIDSANVSGLILLGTQLNLGTNVQSDFFTGIIDSTLEWVQNLSATNPPVDLLLISGSWDDVLTPQAANLLHEKLGGNLSPYKRDLVILDFVFHSYEIYNVDAITLALNWALKELGLIVNPNHFALNILLRNIMWLTSLIGIFVFIIFGTRHFRASKPSDDTLVDVADRNVEITSVKRYLIGKTLLWLAALPILILMFILFVFIPIGVPIFNLIYVGFIGAYGILLIILYKIGKVPGTKGKLRINFDIKNKKLDISFLYGLAIAMALVIIGISFANSGIYYVFPLNERFIWLLILIFFTFPGFYIGRKESKYIKQSFTTKNRYTLYSTIIQIVPFGILTIFYLGLGSLSGMIGSFQGLIILAFVIVGGEFVYHVSESSLLTVIFQAFLIQFLTLPSGVIFQIF